jgi:sortase A
MSIYPYHYTYLKANNNGAFASPIRRRRPKMMALLPGALITVGSILIANVLWPLINYQIFSAPALQKPTLISPVPLEALGNRPPPAASNQSGLLSPQVMGETIDYTNPQTWFPAAKYDLTPAKPTSYTLDIPAVNITKAVVYIGGNDLGQGLIHYPGTPDPGKYGSPVIFGHSILRQFYNPSPKNPRRYLSIFSKIMTLKNSDRIYIDYDGIRYTYEVKDKYEVQPEDLYVLTQHLDAKELKLITCVPEGTYLRRGVVVAQLVDMAGRETTNVMD